MSLIEIKVPDIGDFDEVAVIELLVKAGRHHQGRAEPDHRGVGQGVDGNPVQPRRRGQGTERSSWATRSSKARWCCCWKPPQGRLQSQIRRSPRQCCASCYKCRSSACSGCTGPPAPASRQLWRRRPGMRPAGAGRRPRRLQRGLPRGRPGPEGGAGRALCHAGRRVPERGLHPVQGAAACGGRDGRGEAIGRPGRGVRQAQVDRDKLRGHKKRSSASSPAAWPPWPRCAR
jgi:hypothetical protein